MSRIPPFQPTSSNIAITPNFTAVPTSTGLAQGDMVFWKTGDYQTFTPQSATATFPVSVSLPIMSGVTGGTGGRTNSNLTTTTPSGGNSRGRNVALLSNGNLVVAGMATGGQAYFTIYDSTFTVVVSRVTLSGTSATYNTVGVAALTGGGFVIYYTTSIGNFAYAVYTNTGTVTKALANIATATISTSNNMSAVGLSGGGFVIVGTTTAPNTCYFIFNASGTLTFSSTSLGAASNASEMAPIVVANSNDTFFVLRQQSSTLIAYNHISSANTSLASGTFTITSTGFYSNFTATVLNNGTSIVVMYADATSGVWIYRTYNSSTYVMGGANTYTSPSPAAPVSMYAKTLASGNVFVCISHVDTTWYSVFNSSMVPLISSTTTAASPVYKTLSPKYTTTGFQGAFINNCMFGYETGGLLYTFYSNAYAFGDGFTMYDNIDLTLYNQNPNLSYVASAGTLSSTVSSYDPATLTPVSVSYYSAAATATSVTNSSSFSSLTNIDASSNFDVCTLTNGNFVIAYRPSSGIVYARVYSASGTFLNAITVAGSSYNGFNTVRITSLASGKFVVLYHDTSSSIVCAVYSSSYTFVNSVQITGLNTPGATYNSDTAIGTLSNDRFAVGWNSTGTNYYNVTVYDSNCASLATIATATALEVSDISGMPGGGFAIAFPNNLYFYSEITANTFTLTSTNGLTVSGYLPRMNVTPKGQIVVYASQGNGTGPYARRCYLTDRANNSLTTDILDTVLNNGFTPGPACELSNGSFAYIGQNGANTITATVNYTTTNISSDSFASQTNAIIRPLQNNTAVLLYSSGGGLMKFGILNAAGSYSAAIVPGVTPSQSVVLTSATYGFVGVAANTAAANGVGIVQTNGMAKLNNTYSASVPSTLFTARSGSNPGVSGTISGRNMVLYGSAITGTT